MGSVGTGGFQRNAQSGANKFTVRAVGGSSAITKVRGAGVSVSRTATGAYKITWDEYPGHYVGAVATLAAATIANIDDLRVQLGDFDTSDNSLAVYVNNNTPAAHDLAASEWFTVMAEFSDLEEDG